MPILGHGIQSAIMPSTMVVAKEWKYMDFNNDINFANDQRDFGDRIYIRGEDDVELYGFIATLHEVNSDNFGVMNKKFYGNR